jgi:glucose-6-phosphate dehydrogenase assembly protein OpcA
MIIDLTSTTSSQIASALVRARRNAGSPAMGMIGTIVVVVDEASHHDAMKAANEAGREHPSRVLVAILRPGRGSSGLDAEVRVGEGIPGEAVLLRLHGELAKQPQSVITPLLLPDSPVIVWWPGGGPKVPHEDPLGTLAQRRVTDAAAGRRGHVDFTDRAEGYAPGDTDFAWSRLTGWRALLAAALDQYPTTVRGAEVVSAKGNPSADLLAAWLQSRLKITVEQKTSRGPGITAVRLFTAAGPIELSRPDGSVATFSIPGQPDRPVALKRRGTAELLSEELRRLDPDDVYARTLVCLVERDKMPENEKKLTPQDRRPLDGADQVGAGVRATRTDKAAGREAPATGTARRTAARSGAGSSTKAAAGATSEAGSGSASETGPGSSSESTSGSSSGAGDTKSGAKKATPRNTVAKKAVARKAVTKEVPAKKAVTKEVPAKKAVTKKAPAKKATRAKEAPAKKTATAKVAAKKVPARNSAAKKAVSKDGSARRSTTKRAAGRP